MKFIRFIIPIIVIAISVGLGYMIVKSRPEPDKVKPERYAPLVECIEVQSQTVQLEVKSQGTVQAQTETLLTAEVSGKIVEVSKNFRPGGFFEKDEVLIKIDPADFEAALASAEATLAQRQLRLLEEQAQAEQALLDWKALGQGVPTDLAARKPQVAQAQAAIKSAEAALAQAQRNLERTEVRAPYTGMVLEKMVDIGQSVSGQPGSQLAKIFSIEVAEVRLPISIEESAYLNLPQGFRGEQGGPTPEVILTAFFGGQHHRWMGKIARSEAAIDARSRLLYVVAEVARPYTRDESFIERPPLRVGMFVEAIIKGIGMAEAFVLPQEAMFDRNTVLVVDADNTVHKRKVEIAQRSKTGVIVSRGLTSSETLIVTPLPYVVEGMSVRVVSPDTENPKTKM